MNKLLIDQFNKLILQIKSDIDKYNKQTDYFRLKQITNSLNIIKRYPTEIKSGEELKDIKGIGKGTIDRINEILKSGKLKEIKDISYTDTGDLETIFGIGRKTAYNLVTQHNIKNVKELIKANKDDKIKLSNHILLGLKYHNIYQRVIPREEMNMYNSIFSQVCKKISNNLDLIMCGSYRREKQTSNDVDLLLTNNNIKTDKDLEDNINYLKIVVDILHKLNIIIEDIDTDYKVKYMGFIKVDDKPVRRLDIMYVPYDSYYTAILHFTGSKDFNTKIRQVALNLGYKLNQYGLYLNNKKIDIRSEKEIFDKLNLEYIDPSMR